MLTDDLDKPWFDGTQLSQFTLCPQRYAYRFEEHLVTDDPQWDLLFGIAIHKALEKIYNGSLHETAKLANGSEVPSYIKEFLTHYPNDPDRGPKTRRNGCILLEEYVQKWNPDKEPFKVIAVEQGIIISFERFYIVGRIDIVVDWDNEVMPLDHKTTSRFGEIFEKSFRLDLAQTGYIISVSSKRSACINALRVTDKINDESFVRKLTTRSPEDIERWHWQVSDIVSKIEQYRKEGRWPRHASSCFAYNRVCEFYSLCSTQSKGQEETIKANAYKREPWQPV